MKRILKTRLFMRWMRKTELTDAALCAAVAEMEQGLVDAELGGGVFKKRVALPHRGKRGSTRTLIATNMHSRWVFMFGFEKSDRENINSQELGFLKKYAQKLLAFEDAQIDVLIMREDIQEIYHEKGK